ncbi:DinB family protein [Flavobacteriales bacterium]|jgi:hypothetical protein|nr:DinB family protein [Flavobacteriales bacterium]
MKNETFLKTKLSLRAKAIEVSEKFNVIFEELGCDLTTSSKNDSWTISESITHVYLVNQYLIKKIEKKIEFLHAGLLNNENEYKESDLSIVNTMLNVSVFNIKSLNEFSTKLNYSKDELHLKIIGQFRMLFNLISKVPLDFVNNYLTDMKVISGVRLDGYQLIYFALIHSEHHLNQIITEVSIHELLTKSTKKLKYKKSTKNILVKTHGFPH